MPGGTHRKTQSTRKINQFQLYLPSLKSSSLPSLKSSSLLKSNQKRTTCLINLGHWIASNVFLIKIESERKTLKILCIDHGHEYLSHQLQGLCENNSRNTATKWCCKEKESNLTGQMFVYTAANLIIYTAALAYTKDPKYHGRTKHIDVCFHYIRDMVVRGEVTLNHISTSRMVANPLTKATSRSVFQTHVGSMGLCRL